MKLTFYLAFSLVGMSSLAQVSDAYVDSVVSACWDILEYGVGVDEARANGHQLLEIHANKDMKKRISTDCKS